jgi:hypothetical protein
MIPLSVDGLVTLGDWRAWCVVSPDGVYRYALGRSWSPSLPTLDVFMLNPSKARHNVTDPTTNKVVHFAVQEGCGGILLRNLFAFGATDPRELLAAVDPVGPRNAAILQIHLGTASTCVAAWGRVAKPIRSEAIRMQSLVLYGRRMHALGLTEAHPKEPRHPLYMPNATRLRPLDELLLSDCPA